MEKNENGNSGGKRTVKDLTVKRAASVKGGHDMGGTVHAASVRITSPGTAKA